MYWQVIYFVLGLITINFWLWRQLRLGHESTQIFAINFWLSLAATLGFWWPIAAVAAATLILIWYVKRLKIDFWQWWDTVLPIGLLIFAPLAPWKVGMSMLLGWVFLLLVARFYRRFSWYTSGRMGLVGSLACVVWAVVQVEVAKFSRVWVYLAVLIGVAAVISIYIRSGRKIWLPKRNHPNQ